MLVWFGSLFVMAWGIGVLTLPHAPWFLHLPLLVAGGAIVLGVLRERSASARATAARAPATTVREDAPSDERSP